MNFDRDNLVSLVKQSAYAVYVLSLCIKNSSKPNLSFTPYKNSSSISATFTLITILPFSTQNNVYLFSYTFSTSPYPSY